MRSLLAVQLLLLVQIWSSTTLPIVDPGLFVINGVNTCRAGEGYCLLGLDCTLDKDFLPDDQQGHCDGLRSAFTPSAHFICCKYNAVNTTESPTSTSLAAVEERPNTVTRVTPYTHNQPPDGALVNILMDYLDTNAEPFVPIKPELVANNDLPAPNDDIEVIAETLQSAVNKGSTKEDKLVAEKQEIVEISDPVDIEKVREESQNDRIVLIPNEEKIKIKGVDKDPSVKVEDVTDGKEHDAVKDVTLLPSSEKDVRPPGADKLVDVANTDVIKTHGIAKRPAVVADAGVGGRNPEEYVKRPVPASKQPVVKGQITRVSGLVAHGNDGDIQETELVAMIPVKIIDNNNHVTKKNFGLRRTNASPSVTVTAAAGVPQLQQVNLIPRSLWK